MGNKQTLEQKLREYYKEQERKEIENKKNEIRLTKERLALVNEAKALEKRIGKMGPDEYEKFIDSAIRKLSLKKVQIVDVEDKAERVEQSKKPRTKLTDAQVNAIVLSHVIAFGCLGAGYGVTSGLLLEDAEVQSAILWGASGIGTGVFTSFAHFVAKDENSLVNTLKALKIKMLNKKQRKLEKEVQQETNVIEELGKQNGCVCKYSVDAKIASDRILMGVEEAIEKVYLAEVAEKETTKTEEEME